MTLEELNRNLLIRFPKQIDVTQSERFAFPTLGNISAYSDSGSTAVPRLKQEVHIRRFYQSSASPSLAIQKLYDSILASSPLDTRVLLIRTQPDISTIYDAFKSIHTFVATARLGFVRPETAQKESVHMDRFDNKKVFVFLACLVAGALLSYALFRKHKA